MAQLAKNPPAMQETWVRSLGWEGKLVKNSHAMREDPLEKGKGTHSSTLAWRIPWTVLSMGSQRVGHDWVTFTFTFHPLSAYNLNRKTVKIHMKKLGFIVITTQTYSNCLWLVSNMLHITGGCQYFGILHLALFWSVHSSFFIRSRTSPFIHPPILLLLQEHTLNFL